MFSGAVDSGNAQLVCATCIRHGFAHETFDTNMKCDWQVAAEVRVVLEFCRVGSLI
jgi:hypothetical protein